MVSTYPIAIIALLQCMAIFASAVFTNGNSLVYLFIPVLWTCGAVFLHRLDKGEFVSLVLPYGTGFLLLVLIIYRCIYAFWSLIAPES